MRGAHVAHAHVHAMHLRSWCHVAPSTSPTSPAPQPRANAHMLRHGKLRPWHPLPHRFHVRRPFLVAAGRTKPCSTRKVPCRHGRCREARALEIRVHGSIHGKLKPVMASVPCAGRALRPRFTRRSARASLRGPPIWLTMLTGRRRRGRCGIALAVPCIGAGSFSNKIHNDDDIDFGKSIFV